MNKKIIKLLEEQYIRSSAEEFTVMKKGDKMEVAIFYGDEKKYEYHISILEKNGYIPFFYGNKENVMEVVDYTDTAYIIQKQYKEWKRGCICYGDSIDYSKNEVRKDFSDFYFRRTDNEKSFSIEDIEEIEKEINKDNLKKEKDKLSKIIFGYVDCDEFWRNNNINFNSKEDFEILWNCLQGETADEKTNYIFNIVIPELYGYSDRFYTDGRLSFMYLFDIAIYASLPTVGAFVFRKWKKYRKMQIQTCGGCGCFAPYIKREFHIPRKLARKTTPEFWNLLKKIKEELIEMEEDCKDDINQYWDMLEHDIRKGNVIEN